MTGDWDDLAGKLSRGLLRPHHSAYSRVRRSWVGGERDVLPEAVAVCADEGDVAAALEFARTRSVPFAVRSGGHSYTDASSTPGLLILLADLDAVRLDGDLVTVGPGARLGDVAATLAAHGRCLPTGSCASVALGGSVLAGGFGFLGRTFGLTCDALVSARILLPSGEWASDGDVDWAVRGGGAVGIATSYTLRTFPLPDVTIFAGRWPLAAAAPVLYRWQHALPRLPGDVAAHVSLTLPDFPDEEPFVELFGCTLGSPVPSFLLSGCSDLFVRDLSGPAAASYVSGGMWRRGEVFPVSSTVPPAPGFQRSASAFVARPIPATGLAALVAALEQVPGEQRDVEFTPWGGAYGAVSASDSAFVHRDDLFLVAVRAVLGASAAAARRSAASDWVRRCAEAVSPYATGRSYQGYAGPSLSPEFYGSSAARLATIVRRHDPDGLFGR
ncbi:FAD-binding oxidoreductase [Hamadaea tsunoensis]|uniref:FAD-binding oxidoreductase n=1 Tax=Hamadaea tsunoensis TaxID=53368 RepID=UPI00042006CB|nr:FAD-binding oxidoreductase [Hamadaea tsunoensis]